MPEPLRKRRAVRKGTRNCWECKRRKVRCILATPSSTACENCLQRHTSCVSQEFEQESGLNVGLPTEGLEARLIRVENLLHRLLSDKSKAGVEQGTPADEDERSVSEHESHSSVNPAQDRTNAHIQDVLYEAPTRSTNSLLTPSISPRSRLGSSTPTSDYTRINQRLFALWPNEHDLDYIYEFPAHLSTHLNLGTSPARDTPRRRATVRTMLQIPPKESHPVLIARKLLMLGSLLQGALSMPHLPVQRREKFEQLMLAILDTVTKSVTTHEELNSSIEGVQCIMFEALIQNHTGKLRQAWRILRRAITLSQTLGLHRNIPVPPRFFVDPATRIDFDVEHFCFQLVCMDRYLSMTLGLPPASRLPFASTPEQLAAFNPIDRMARLQCNITEHLLARTKKDLQEDRDIDTLLLEASAQMPHQWWLVPEPGTIPGAEQSHIDVVARFTFQLSHYHLLLRLYLPYVLQPVNKAEHIRGKHIAWSASRKILTVFLAYRKWNSSGYYCRGMDFLALIALTVLCVAHIDSRRAGAETLGELVHDHPADRAMLLQVLHVMQWSEYDELASKMDKMMQSLLNIEADAANGIEYSATAIQSDEQATEYQSEFLDEGRKLQLRIPYFGTILLQQVYDSASSDATFSTCHSVPHVQDNCGSSLDREIDWSLDCDVDWSQQVSTGDDWTLQTVNQALFLDLFGTV